jgi:hypothetical protein
MDITQEVFRAVSDGSGRMELFRNMYELGFVRLAMHDDPTFTFADLCGDCYSPEVNPDIPAEQLAKEKAAFRRRVNREGVHGVCVEVRENPQSEWGQVGGNVVDSIWGFVGLDFIGSGYEMDLINTAADWALENVNLAFVERVVACAKLQAQLIKERQ